jgi:hypothetical protein
MDDNDYKDAEKLLMDSWYDFVCAEMKTINTYLDYNEQVWYECGEKEKIMRLYQNKPFYKALVEHVEERREKFDLLRRQVLNRRQKESEEVRFERKYRMGEKFFRGFDIRQG